MTGAGLGTPAAVVPFGLDGSTHFNTGGTANPITLTLTTSDANDIIIVDITTNGGPIVSVSSVALGNFTHHASSSDTTTAQNIERWYAVSSGILSTDIISVTLTSQFEYTTVDAYGISGAHTASPFDSGGPVTDSSGGNTSAGGADPYPITTANANTMIIGAYRASTASPTAGSGFTQISGADFQLTEYKIVSTTQSALNVTMTTGAGGAAGGVIDAIIKGP